jgi:hypothetical protein
MLNQSIKLRWAAVFALLLAMACELAHVARATSSTWDEPHHLFDGYWVWTQHDYRLNAEVPPLVKLTAALPALTMKLKIPAEASGPYPNAFLVGKAFVYGNGGDRVLFPARMACSVFTLGLGLLIFLAGKEMFGVAAVQAGGKGSFAGGGGGEAGAGVGRGADAVGGVVGGCGARAGGAGLL